MNWKFTLNFVLLFFMCQAILAQNNQFDNQERKGVIYNKEFTIDTRLLTYGFSFAANWTKINTFRKSSYFQLEIGELRHPKEYRQGTESQFSQGSSQSFFLGKMNNLYAIRAGFGRKKYLSEKAKKKGVAIGLNYAAGATLGLLKPYYLDIIQSDGSSNPTIVPYKSEKFDPDRPCTFLDHLSHVHGASGFFKGISEVRPLPGIHAKGGIIFDWGAFDEFVKAIEVGLAVDVFYKRAPILIHIDDDMVERMQAACPHVLQGLEVQDNPNRPYFINLYVSLQLGKRS